MKGRYNVRDRGLHRKKIFVKICIQKQVFHASIGFVVVLKDSGYDNDNKHSRLIYEYPKHLKIIKCSKETLHYEIVI